MHSYTVHTCITSSVAVHCSVSLSMHEIESLSALHHMSMHCLLLQFKFTDIAFFCFDLCDGLALSFYLSIHRAS